MDPRLIAEYEAELEYLRGLSLEFAAENESVAGRLGFTGTERDPYVERLLEGVAFLSSRVQLKIKDQFPDFTQALLQAIQPHYLAPTPSMCIVGFEPKPGDPGLLTGQKVPRRSQLTADPPVESRTPVTFETGHEVTLWPLQVAKAEYLGSAAAAARFAQMSRVRAEAALTIRLEAQEGLDLGSIEADEIEFYLDGSDNIANELYHQLIGRTIGVVATPAEGPPDRFARLDLPEQHGFGPDCALLPDDGRTLGAYRMLTEYFACPERYRFVKLRGLRRALKLSDKAVDITFLFPRTSNTLVQSVDRANFRLYATPAINLFEKPLNRVLYSSREREFKVVADRDGPFDFEVFRLLEVKAYERDNQNPREVSPLYSFGAQLFDYRSALFYTTRLSLSKLPKRTRRMLKRDDYTGTDTHITVTAGANPEALEDIYELAFRALVTNRELAPRIRVSGDSHLSSPGVPARGIRILRKPTLPRAPLGLGEEAWRVIGHLTPNYATLVRDEAGDPRLLRDHLALYGPPGDPVMRSQISAIKSVRAEPVTRRVPGRGHMALARGMRVELELDESTLEQSRLFMFSAIVERFLAGFVTVNCFTESVFHTQQEREMAVWPPRIGRREII
ncbi:MAG: type VI secretion system baseplate subunit TssF [Erythrobacter sp.]|jgi:type VI secretion system protein ImpG|nr:type VI secretion system baseplate subunit TssF [Erythrobacter sp.]